MKINNARRRSNLIVAVLFCGVGLAGAFVAPARLPTRAVREWGAKAPGAQGTDTSSNQSSKTGTGVELADRTRAMRNQMRDAIWKATDSITHAVEDMPEVGTNTDQALTRLGNLVEDIEEKYFSKYLSVGAKPAYRDTLAAAASTATREGKVTKKDAVAGSTLKDGDAEKKTKSKTAEGLESAVSEASETVGAAAESISASAGAAVETVEKAAGEAEAAAVSSASSKKGNAGAASGSASGTVQLDRPKQVQGVFDEIQKKAVEYYKSSPVTATLSSAKGSAMGGKPALAGVATPLPEAVQALEAQLESLLEESKFKPRKLKKNKKSELVDAISAMEAAYPADANPLGDPALSGQWSVVYSSSSKLIGRAVRGVLAGFFKTSDARQVVDTGASSVLNACRARLRMTPLAVLVATKGSYRATAERKVLVEMPAKKKGFLRRLLPSLRPGKVEAEVTYLSNKWRICRAGGVTVAFRKSGE
ncbi:unnamed protein product [Pylaiella littoralis]